VSNPRSSPRLIASETNLASPSRSACPAT
jgi:hypothetical protein